VLRIISLVLILFLLAIPIFGWWAAQSALPVLDGLIPISDLYRNVVIKFDERGVPSIEAASENDAYFVQGYITAAQRLFQMDILRRTACGELSEVFGSSCIPHDRLMRTIGINRLAVQNDKKLSREVKDSLTAYSRGVNTYIEQNQGRLSIPFTLLGYKPRLWQNADSLAILKFTQYKADESWQLDDLRQRILDKIGPQMAPQLFGALVTPARTSYVGPTDKNAPEEISWSHLSTEIARCFQNAASIPTSPLIGSNAWVVNGSMSESNGAILACDKHSLFTFPDFYYLCSITSPKLHMAGATIAGVPGIYLGRNDNLSWAQTAFKVDGQDLVLEKFSPQFANRYKTSAGWAATQELTEDIKVRFANTLVHKIVSTKNGPILSKSEENGVALAWASSLEKTPVYESMWRINRAKTARELLAILNNYSGSPESFVYADKAGDSGFHVAGCIPLHTGETGASTAGFGSFGTIPASGWNETLHWPSKLAFAQLPHSESNQAFAVADPPFTMGNSAPYRYNRISSLLAGVKQKGQKVGLPDMAFLQSDQTVPLAELVKREVAKALTASSIIDKFTVTGHTALEKWDGVARGDSIGASIYESFLQTMMRRLLEPRLGLTDTLEYMDKYPGWTTLAENILRTQPVSLLPAEERSYQTFIATTFVESIKNIRLGVHSDDSTKWSWQNLHTLSLRDEFLSNAPFYKVVLGAVFAVPTAGVGGDANTVDACNVVAEADQWMFTSNTGPTARLLIDMADSDKFYANLSLGQSEHLMSVYRTDQFRNWLRVEPSVVAFSAAEADKQMQHKLILANR
jgi:penicillin amidase